MTSEESPSASKEQPLERSESGVFEFTNDNFNEGISTEEPTLILFYTTWCGACKQFKPIFKNAAKELIGKNNIRFALFDCTEAEDRLEEFSIAYVPILKLFKKGKFECDYKGEKDMASLIKFAETHGVALK